MPVGDNGQYIAPTFVNNNAPALDADEMNGMAGAAAGAVEYDREQFLSATQKTRGRLNISAAAQADVTALQQTVQQLGSQFTFKGATTSALLPQVGNVVNDTYFVTDLGYNETWNGTEWKQSGSPITVDSNLETAGYAADAQKTGNAIADQYSASSSYDIGDIVLYQGDLYKCITAIPVAEAWNDAHWSATTTSSEIERVAAIEPRVDNLEDAVYTGEIIDWNQIIENGNFVSTDGWKKAYNQQTLEADSNEITLTVTSASYRSRFYRDDLEIVGGHKYYVHGEIKASDNTYKLHIELGGADIEQAASAANTWTVLEGVVTPAADGTTIYIAYGNSAISRLPSGGTLTARNVWATDLTYLYGEGNEPSAVKFREQYPDDYYKYTPVGEGVKETWIDVNKASIAELRDKIDELSGIAGNEVDSDVQYIRTKIPSYWNYLNTTDPASYDDGLYLENKISHIPEKGKSFIFITDTHYNGNEKHSIDLMTYVRKRTGIKKVLFGGDALGYEDDKYKAKFKFGEFLYGARWAFGSDFIPAVGDHDWNGSTTVPGTALFPLDVMRELFVADLARTSGYHTSAVFYKDKLDSMLEVHGTDIPAITQEQRDALNDFFDTIYYVDDNADRIRYIVINCGCSQNDPVIEAVFGSNNMSQCFKLAADFVADALMTTPAGWDIVNCNHKSGQNPTGDATMIHKVVSGYARKDSACKPYPGSSDNANMEWWYPHTKTYNLSDHEDYNKIIVMNGHQHVDEIHYFGMLDDAYVTKEEYEDQILDQKALGQVPCITTKTDAAANTVVAHPMTPGTVTEQAFDVVTLVDDGVVITRFGEGSDRRVYIQG